MNSREERLQRVDEGAREWPGSQDELVTDPGLDPAVEPGEPAPTDAEAFAERADELPPEVADVETYRRLHGEPPL